MSAPVRQRLPCVLALLVLSGFAWPQRIETLLAQLENGRDLAEKVDAARLLGRIAPRRAEQALRAAAQADEPELRAAAAEVLGRARIGTDLLRALLSDTSANVRAQAVHALVMADDEASCDLLQRALSDEEPGVRAASALAVGQLCGEDKTAAIKALLDDPSSQVKRAASEALEQLAAVDRATAPRVEAMAHAKARWLPWLLKSGDPQLSALDAQQTLEQLEAQLPPGEALAADPLLDWLPRAPDGLRARIAHLLVETRAQVDSRLVVPWLSRTDRDLQLALLELLRVQRKEPPLAHTLWPLLSHADAQIRHHAADALAMHADGETVRLLGAALAKSSVHEREAVARALAYALPHTRAALSRWSRWRLKRHISRALAQCAEPCAAQLVRAQAQLDAQYATRVLTSQRTLSPARRVALLRATLNDRGPSARALRALYAASPLPMEASTALTAQLLANELDDHALIAKLDDTRWPAAPIAAYGLTTRSGALSSADQERICAHLASARDSITRLNLHLAVVLRKVHCSASAEPFAVENVPDLRPTWAPMTFRALRSERGGVLITVSDAAANADWSPFVALGEHSLWHSPYRAIE